MTYNSPFPSGDPRGYDVETLREAYDSEYETESDGEDDDHVPTHRCGSCWDYETYIESCPIHTYRWCPDCESVTRFKRLDLLAE